MRGVTQCNFDIIYKFAYILTALACAILRTGFNPSFAIFFMTGTYDIGMTSTGIPFLNCNSIRHTHCKQILPLTNLLHVSLPPGKLTTVTFHVPVFFFCHSNFVQNQFLDNDTRHSYFVLIDSFSFMYS